MAAELHTEPVDVHLILRRDTGAGGEVLLSRRAGPVYATGLWHLPSGHLDGPHEDVVTAVIREAREETGVVIAPDDVHAVLTVHHRNPHGGTRVGVFFEVRRWQGTPRVLEPTVCDAMGWYRLDALPEPMVAYCRAGLDAYRAGSPLGVHFQQPEDPIAHDSERDRLQLVPAPGGHGRPEEMVREFAERAVGRITDWVDVSWARETSRVWRAHGESGGTWFVKAHPSARFHDREVTAYRTWTPQLVAAAPRLVAACADLRAVVVTAVPGKPLHGAVHPPAAQRRVFHRIGQLAAAIHHSTPPGRVDGGPNLEKIDRHLKRARPHLRPGDEDFVRAVVRGAERMPGLPRVPTHGDLQLRNLLHSDDGAVFAIDFERSEPGPAVRDLVRLSDAWHGRPDLHDAFFSGYGRTLTPGEEARLAVEEVLDAVSGIGFATTYADPELLERGHRTLARHRAARTGTPTTPIER